MYTVSCKELLTEKTHSGFLKHDWTLTVSCCPTAVKAIARVGTWGEGVVYVYTYPTALGWKLKKSLHTPIILMLWPFFKIAFFSGVNIISSRGWVTASLFQNFSKFSQRTMLPDLHRGPCLWHLNQCQLSTSWNKPSTPYINKNPALHD